MIPLLLMRIAGFFMPVDSKRILRRFTYGFASAGACGFFESTRRINGAIRKSVII